MIDYRQIAKNWLQPYVARGTAETFVRDMGCFSNGFGIVVGGYAEGRRITNNQLAVFKRGGKVHIFKKSELIEELTKGQLQLL